MRVVFMGTPDFAVPSLRALASRHEVTAVYTKPDSASGRGGALRFSAVKQCAVEYGISVRQPRSLKDPAEQRELELLKPDVICVTAYGLLLPAEVLAIPRYCSLNVHASLLPRWRGAAPIERAILSGDSETGVCVMRMEEGIDTGPFTHAVSAPTDEFTAAELGAQLAAVGATALVETIDELAENAVAWIEQDESLATYAPKIGKADVALAPELAVADALRRVRASSGRAPARLRFGGTVLTVLRALVAPGRETLLEPGSGLVERHRVLLGFSDGVLELVSVKPEGKHEMSPGDWARGARLSGEATWDCAL